MRYKLVSDRYFMKRFWHFQALNRVGIRNSSDYSPFGVELDGRRVSLEGYRFGYQGSEKDNEFKGEGNSYTTEFRQLDPRLGRWLTIDPLFAKFPWQSSYTSFDNNPPQKIDIDGNEATDWFVNIKTGTVIYIKGESKVTQKKLDKLGSNFSPKDYERIGDDNMFGAYVNEFSKPDNILNKEVYALQYLSKNFMESHGYYLGNKITVRESMITSGGRMGSENFSSTNYTYKISNSGSLTYIKYDDYYQKEFISKSTTSGFCYNNSTVVYNTIVPNGNTGESQAYFKGNQIGDQTKTIIDGIGVILEIIDLVH